MAQLVGETLDVVWFQAWLVPDDIVVGWCHSALTHTLGHQEEVITGGEGKENNNISYIKRWFLVA